MSFLERAWHKRARWLILLWPVSVLFQLLTTIRRAAQQSKKRPADLTAPLIVIGNISLGGTGKTPLLIALSQELQKQGFQAWHRQSWLRWTCARLSSCGQ